jgi:hypothetical protein
MTLLQLVMLNACHFGPECHDFRSEHVTISMMILVVYGLIYKLLMTHKYRGCIVVFSINKSVEPNEEQKVLMSGFDQGFTVNTSKQVFRGIW